MNIKDLELSHEMSREEQAAVSGGNASNGVLALMSGSALQNGPTGVSIGSPTIQVNPQIQTIVPTATDINLDLHIANILQSANSLVAQG
jgi:hypothetical protein